MRTLCQRFILAGLHSVQRPICNKLPCRGDGVNLSICELSTPPVHLKRTALLMQAVAGSCQPPLVNKDALLAANKVYDDTCYVLPR